jgi:hypothetical protein
MKVQHIPVALERDPKLVRIPKWFILKWFIPNE